MKQYELTVLYHPDLEMNMQPALDKVEKILTDNGATIKKATNEGKRRLAYSIKAQDFAVYYYYELEIADQNAANKISSVLNITDEVLRYLIVSYDPRRAKANEAKVEAEENSAEEEADK